MGTQFFKIDEIPNLLTCENKIVNKDQDVPAILVYIYIYISCFVGSITPHWIRSHQHGIFEQFSLLVFSNFPRSGVTREGGGTYSLIISIRHAPVNTFPIGDSASTKPCAKKRDSPF